MREVCNVSDILLILSYVHGQTNWGTSLQKNSKSWNPDQDNYLAQPILCIKKRGKKENLFLWNWFLFWPRVEYGQLIPRVLNTTWLMDSGEHWNFSELERFTNSGINSWKPVQWRGKRREREREILLEQFCFGQVEMYETGNRESEVKKWMYIFVGMYNFTDVVEFTKEKGIQNTFHS